MSDSESEVEGTQVQGVWNFALERCLPDVNAIPRTRKSHVKTENELLVDSGAFTHCAPESFGDWFPLVKAEVPRVFSAGGNALTVLGQ